MKTSKIHGLDGCSEEDVASKEEASPTNTVGWKFWIMLWIRYFGHMWNGHPIHETVESRLENISGCGSTAVRVCSCGTYWGAKRWQEMMDWAKATGS